jgi:2-methylisocitrate lyase-like PEP mutase family enzyme
MPTQQEKYERFRALHEGDKALVVPNLWHVCFARLLTSFGFEALATTSAGFAYSKGKRDSYAGLSRDEIFKNAADRRSN